MLAVDMLSVCLCLAMLFFFFAFLASYFLIYKIFRYVKCSFGSPVMASFSQVYQYKRRVCTCYLLQFRLFK